jgi:hypothetical protein
LRGHALQVDIDICLVLAYLLVVTLNTQLSAISFIIVYTQSMTIYDAIYAIPSAFMCVQLPCIYEQPYYSTTIWRILYCCCCPRYFVHNTQTCCIQIYSQHLDGIRCGCRIYVMMLCNTQLLCARETRDLSREMFTKIACNNERTTAHES